MLYSHILEFKGDDIFSSLSFQTRPVVFSVLATVTTSDLSFSLESLDFGSCTVHESVVLPLEITNNSLLPQKFGFVHLPPCVEVQPNDGFGQLLPHETLPVDVIFSASKPKEYSFELTCKTGIDRYGDIQQVCFLLCWPLLNN